MFLGSPVWHDVDTWTRKTGIGTYVAKHGSVLFTPIVKKISKLLDTAVAWNLASHTQCSYSITALLTRDLRVLLSAGYEFLMQHCSYFSGSRPTGQLSSSIFILDQFGDKICIFGFSRGAYTARALAGMLAKVCIPPVSSTGAPLPPLPGWTPPL